MKLCKKCSKETYSTSSNLCYDCMFLKKKQQQEAYNKKAIAKMKLKAKERKIKEKVKKQKNKEKKANSPTTLRKKCDKLWREKVIEFYGDKCIICGDKERLNIHHLVSRANKATRWYIPNGVPLCPLHHTFGNQSAHNHPFWFRGIMVDFRGVNWENDLIKKSNEIWNKNYSDVLEYLNGL